MIYDCFCYFNEDDVLDIRLNSLNNVVDKFVIVEANITFSGENKPCNFDFKRFESFKDKIIYVFLEDMPNFNNPWAYENYQRNYILEVLKQEKCNEDDIIIISDLDEIPSESAIQEFKTNPSGVKALALKFYNTYLNLLNLSETPWMKARILTYKEFFNPNNDTPPCFGLIEDVNDGITPTKIRMKHISNSIQNAGWHFSYMGGAEAISYKIKSFAHQEFNKEEFTNLEIIKTRIKENKDVLGRNQQYLKVSIDNTFPKYLCDNIKKFDKHILN